MSTPFTLTQQPSFIGVGTSFPRRLDTNSARPVLSRHEDRVKESIAQILGTNPEERPYLVRNGIPFGTRIGRIIFEDASIAASIIDFEARRALDVWEPRISVTEIMVSDPVQVQMRLVIEAEVFFTYRSTRRADNLVVPYSIVRRQS